MGNWAPTVYFGGNVSPAVACKCRSYLAASAGLSLMLAPALPAGGNLAAGKPKIQRRSITADGALVSCIGYQGRAGYEN